MAMSRSEMDRRMDQHFAYEAADDIGGVLATLAADGAMQRENVWVDMGAVFQQLPQA